jgi:hypothetical protein
MRNVLKSLVLSASLLFCFSAQAQTVNGSKDAAFAIGKWKESHEGVSLFCVRVTSTKEVVKGNSNAVCFLSEAQGIAKDSAVMSTNTFAVTSWDENGLAAVTEFYADKDGNQVDKSSPGSTKYKFRLVLKFGTHQVTKFVEYSNGNTLGFHLVGQ